MRSAELRLKEETAVARLEGIEQGIKQGIKQGIEQGSKKEQKESVKSMYRLYKRLKPNATVEEVLPLIQENSNVSLSTDEIRNILKEEK